MTAATAFALIATSVVVTASDGLGIIVRHTNGPAIGSGPHRKVRKCSARISPPNVKETGAPWLDLRQGDALTVLRTLSDECVNCVVTSPPYWGLRDYGVPYQIGLEPGPDEYVVALSDVFAEVYRVLRKDGTLWLNLGDSYAVAQGATAGRQGQNGQRATRTFTAEILTKGVPPGLKNKDLVGIPWRVAFSLQWQGWYLRADIIWSKPNAMPESVTDRPTKAHEYLFLLSKSPRYYYDADTIRERSAWVDADGYPVDSWGRRVKPPLHQEQGRPYSAIGLNPIKSGDGMPRSLGAGVTDGRRNKRSVWEIATQPYPEAHFATFPPDLIKPCILAGCPEGGVVLDPFLGSGTTAMVANQLGRRALGIELNPAYLKLARERCKQITLWEAV